MENFSFLDWLREQANQLDEEETLEALWALPAKEGTQDD